MAIPFVSTLRAGAPAGEAAQKRGFWRRWFDAFQAQQERRAELEIARLSVFQGMKFTDAAERAIERRLFAPRHDHHRN